MLSFFRLFLYIHHWRRSEFSNRLIIFRNNFANKNKRKLRIINIWSFLTQTFSSTWVIDSLIACLFLFYSTILYWLYWFYSRFFVGGHILYVQLFLCFEKLCFERSNNNLVCRCVSRKLKECFKWVYWNIRKIGNNNINNKIQFLHHAMTPCWIEISTPIAIILHIIVKLMS